MNFAKPTDEEQRARSAAQTRAVTAIEDVTSQQRALQRVMKEAKRVARASNVTKKLKAQGWELPAAPDPDLLRLSSHLDDAWTEAEFATLIQMTNDWNEEELPDIWRDPMDLHAARAASLCAYELRDARVLTVSTQQFESLPKLDDHAEGPTYNRIMAVLREEPLPWPVTWLETKGKMHQAPTLTAKYDGDPAAPRWVGALCREKEGAMRVTPFVTIGQTEIATCLGELVFVDEMPEAVRKGEVFVKPGDNGRIELLGATGTGADDNLMAMVMLTLEKVAATLQVLNAVNVTTEPKTLGGKNAKRQKRTGHPRPHVIRVSKRSGGGGEATGTGQPLANSHYVRGHWMHITKGRTFEANPEARRWIPQLECEAVRIWRHAHVRGPDNQPSTTTTLEM